MYAMFAVPARGSRVLMCLSVMWTDGLRAWSYHSVGWDVVIAVGVPAFESAAKMAT